MKMYYFNPNDYGVEYFVMAENKIMAHGNLIQFLEKKLIDKTLYIDGAQYDLDLWKKINPLDATTFPDKYTLDEYEVGSVIQSEIA